MTNQKQTTNQNQKTNQKQKTNGFKIGKRSNSTESYRGKAIQIKKTLIHKAKLKKQRAKELIKAGYTNSNPNQSIINQTQSNFTNSFQSNPKSKVNHSMDLDSSPHQKLGPRKDGMRIDDDHQSQTNSLKRSQTSSNNISSHDFIESQPNSKKRKIHESPLLTSSSNQTESNHSKPIHRSSFSRLKRNQILHSNGQPRLSIKLNRMLDKIQRDT
ncbi:hypothetical protein DFH28DRAFT_1081219 [Melampsora americana]|nr:hypothetical protein DFH28DRAFT_1081219 [Melampsora americana]